MAKVLIIDDDRDLTTSLSAALRGNNFEVTEAHNRDEGLEKLLSEKPDILVLDAMLERETDGFDIFYKLRNPSKTSAYFGMSGIPIIMMSSINKKLHSSFTSREGNALPPGINEFLEKPVQLGKVLDTVQEFA